MIAIFSSRRLVLKYFNIERWAGARENISCSKLKQSSALDISEQITDSKRRGFSRKRLPKLQLYTGTRIMT